MRTILVVGSLLVGSLGMTSPAHAGLLELSGAFSFSQSSLGKTGTQWTRRWLGSVGYYFFGLSEIEFAVQDVMYRTKIDNVEDTSFHDRIYSVNWVQSLAPRSSFLQPYFKVGVGQLNRNATGSYWTGDAPDPVFDSLTAVLGAGLKIQIFRALNLKAETTTYLTNGAISTWKDNVYVNFGVSLYL
jgi:hypothetical protein